MRGINHGGDYEREWSEECVIQNRKCCSEFNNTWKQIITFHPLLWTSSGDNKFKLQKVLKLSILTVNFCLDENFCSKVLKRKYYLTLLSKLKILTYKLKFVECKLYNNVFIIITGVHYCRTRIEQIANKLAEEQNSYIAKI